MTATIDVFNMPKVVTLTLGGNTGATLMNYPINRTDFTLVRGATNEIIFFVKDVDRKPVTANAMVTLGINDLRIIVSDHHANSLLLGTNNAPVSNAPVDASVLQPYGDTTKGMWLLTLRSSDTANWPLGGLRYSVVADRATDQVMLYTDRNYGPYSDCELVDGPFPMPPEAITLQLEDLQYDGPSLYSGALPGAATLGNISGQQSAVINMTGFMGSVTVQASLENQPSSQDLDWFTAQVDTATLGTLLNGTVTFQNATDGPVYLSITGNYMWVRFIVYIANIPSAPAMTPPPPPLQSIVFQAA